MGSSEGEFWASEPRVTATDFSNTCPKNFSAGVQRPYSNSILMTDVILEIVHLAAFTLDSVCRLGGHGIRKLCGARREFLIETGNRSLRGWAMRVFPLRAEREAVSGFCWLKTTETNSHI